MKSPFHFILGLPGHLKHPEWLFEHFHNNIHHAFVVFSLAIIGMLWGASHILTPTSASWQWWGFLTSDFWDQSPSDANITYALFGDGSAWSTAYTRLWNSSCIPTNSIVTLPTNFTGWLLAANTIYIMNSGSYTFTSPIVINGNCSALLGKGEVIINEGINITNIQHIIIDNIWIHDVASYYDGAFFVSWWNNISFNNIQAYNNAIPAFGIYIINSAFVNIYDSQIYNNILYKGGMALNNVAYSTFNNLLVYNNLQWIVFDKYSHHNTINNSQFYNNISHGISILGEENIINNSMVYNNTWYGISINPTYPTPVTWINYINNTSLYNNGTGVYLSTGEIDFFGTIKFFDNTIATWWAGTFDINPGSSPISSWISAGSIDTTNPWLSYDRMTNPQNGSGQWLLSGTNRTWVLRWTQSFDTSKRSIRYIFWGNILKQIMPVWYNGTLREEYGSDGADYSTTRYIAEPESSLPAAQQSLVNQYFWSGSLFTQNWQTNWCSLSAFQIVYLNPGTFWSTYSFQDHTLYILTGGEYRSTITTAGDGFAFSGNCIALIGNDNTRFTKSGRGGMATMLHADNKRNIIIDTIKIDGYYYDVMLSSTKMKTAIKFDGTTNNTTLNNVQIYNTSMYGMYLGLGSSYNTIMNTQAFNNAIAGIYLYYSSNYNVINNTQTYNNGLYGIWLANWSNRNTINNFQSYNNTIGIFWDLTTKENVINRAALFNNSDAGIYFKNASGNMLNDVMIYHNTIGIKTLYSSLGNKYYGELKLFDNWSNFDGTIGNDTYLSPGTAGLFPYGGTLTTGSTAMSCLYATNPTLSGDWTTLLNGSCTNTWFTTLFESYQNTHVNYAFGLNIYKQKVPVRYDSGNNLIQIPLQYDASKYIAEIFAIRDTTPEGMIFASSGSTQLNTWYTSNIYTAGVLNVSVTGTLILYPSTASGYLMINGSNVGLTWTVNNGDVMKIYVLTSTWYNETITGSVTVWTVTTGFIVTTRWASQTPTTGSLAFANLTSVPFNTFTWSATTIAGLETGVLASIIFDPITTFGRLEIYSWTTIVSSWTNWLLVYNGNQVKAIAQSSSWYTQTITGQVTIGLGTGAFTITTKGSDVTPPTTPVVTYPLSGEELFFITLEWTASTDTGSGLEWYAYEIADDSSFIDIIDTGFITTVTGTSSSPNSENINNDTYYWRIKAKDKNGNFSARSTTGSFKAVEFDTWNFDEKTNANLRTYYDSDEITLEGIKPWLFVWATVDANWTLYKNGNDKGTGALVQNGDKIYITVRSKNDYNKTASSLLTIANRTLEFNVTTKDESANNECTLSDNDKTTIQTIYDSLVQNYAGDANKFDEFLYTMKSMLADEIDFTNDCNLQYLEDLINWAIGTNGWWTIDTGNHIAPNCKEYPVSFDSTRMAYTSPTFKVITFFANRDSLIRYIDSKNPGDCHINTYGASSWSFTNTDPSKHIAPNGKFYTIQSDSQWYTANEFTVKRYFATISDLRNYINSKNPPQEIRSHQVDTSFTPQVYIASNGKDYTIYKTDRWYMSYKLMKVRYFSSLAEIQSFINKNNK